MDEWNNWLYLVNRIICLIGLLEILDDWTDLRVRQIGWFDRLDNQSYHMIGLMGLIWMFGWLK